ncbi:MAG: peptide deformylase [Polyangia bacterium]
MPIRKIAQIGHPVLRTPARPVTREELGSAPMQAFIDDLIATMRDADGAGLAAPQVYEPVQICALEVGDNPRYPYKPKIPLTILVNPVLEPITEQTFSNYEGCLSVPNLRGRVDRFVELRVRAWDRHGNDLDFVARGISAGTYQHEVDHLHGRLFIDRVTDPRSLCTWQEFERHHKAGFVAEVRAIVDRWGS